MNCSEWCQLVAAGRSRHTCAELGRECASVRVFTREQQAIMDAQRFDDEGRPIYEDDE